jgi:hypothetical protein
MKTKLMALLLVVMGGSLFAQPRFSIGVNFGAPAYYGPAPVALAAYRPVRPGPGYIWIDGYRDGYGRWTAGYWVAPRYYGGHYDNGYWGGERRYYRNDYRSREHEWREHERREHEYREHFRR